MISKLSRCSMTLSQYIMVLIRSGGIRQRCAMIQLSIVISSISVDRAWPMRRRNMTHLIDLDCKSFRRATRHSCHSNELLGRVSAMRGVGKKRRPKPILLLHRHSDPVPAPAAASQANSGMLPLPYPLAHMRQTTAYSIDDSSQDG